MRKTLALALSVLMVLTMFTVLPAAAADPSDDFAFMDFEYPLIDAVSVSNTLEEDGVSMEPDVRYPSGRGEVKEEDGNHFFRFTVARRPIGDPNSAWPSAYRIYDPSIDAGTTADQAFRVSAGTKYTLTMRYRVPSKQPSTLRLDLVRAKDGSGIGMPTGDSSGTIKETSRIATLVNNILEESDWKTVSIPFTAPADASIVIMATTTDHDHDYNKSDSGVAIDIDDIKVESAGTTAIDTVNTMDEEGVDFTAGVRFCDRASSSGAKNEVLMDDDGNAFFRFAGKTADADNYWPNNFLIYDPAADATDNADQAFVPAAGSYWFSLRYRVHKTGDLPSGNWQLRLLRLINDSLGNPDNKECNSYYIPGAITISNTEGDWVDAFANVTMPEFTPNKDKLLLVLSSTVDSGGSYGNYDVQIDVDDIQLLQADGYFYPDSNNQSVRIAYAGEEHGRAAWYNEIVWESGNHAWPRTVRVRGNDGTPFRVQSGKSYEISLDMLRYFCPTGLDLDGRSLTVGAYFDETGSASAGNLGGMDVAKSKGHYTTLLTFDPGQSSTWETKTATFTAPCDGEMLLMLVHTGQLDYNNKLGGAEILIDNVSISSAVEADGTKIDVKYHYNQPGTEDATLASDKGKAYLTPAAVVGQDFVGWYADEGLTIPAPPTVRESCTEVWAKWEARASHDVDNTFEDEGIDFIADHFGGNGAAGTAHIETEGDNHFLRLAGWARPTENSWPMVYGVYDTVPTNYNGDYRLNEGGWYRISLRYRVNTAPGEPLRLWLLRIQNNKLGNPNWGTDHPMSYYSLGTIADITAKTDGWQEFSILVNAPHQGDSLGIILTTNGGSDFISDTISIDIDDIKVREIVDTGKITFHTNGGNPIAALSALANEDIPDLPVPVKAGEYFEGWYLDDGLTQPFNLDKMPEIGGVDLYAKWSTPPTEATAFTTGFEAAEYGENAPYKNDGAEGKENVTDDYMEAGVTWNKDNAATAAGGTGSMTFQFADTATSHAVALANPDGSKFKVIAGQRYRLTFSVYVQDSGPTLTFLTSQATPVAGINSENSIALFSEAWSALTWDTAALEWSEQTFYFEAAATGNVYLSINSSVADRYLYLDDLSITPVTNEQAVRVRYFDDAGNLVATRIGEPGSNMIPASNNSKTGKSFNGWRDADGKLYSAAVLPNADLDLTATWKDAETVKDYKVDWSSDLVIDFEQTEDVAAFYGDSNNNNGPQNGLYVVTDDPEGAHSGNNYFHFNQTGHWVQQWWRRFRLFGKDTPGHVITLDPDSVYKISYWMKIDDLTGAGNLMICLFNKDGKSMATDLDHPELGPEVVIENYKTPADAISNFGKWFYVEDTINTYGKDTCLQLGMIFSGGYLTASIDDFTITRIKPITVTFDSNGGSPVDDILQNSHDYVFEPMAPTREGYTFAGWYTDKALTHPFIFTETLVYDDLHLYAKWVPAVVEKQPEPTYRTEVTYETTYETQTVENDIPDAYLDEAVQVGANDTIGEIHTGAGGNTAQATPGGIAWWIILLICVGGVIVLAAIATTTVLIVRKRSKKGGERIG